MEPIGLNDIFTLVNTVLCVIIVLLRMFYYKKNPDIDTLIEKAVKLHDEFRRTSKKLEEVASHDANLHAAWAAST